MSDDKVYQVVVDIWLPAQSVDEAKRIVREALPLHLFPFGEVSEAFLNDYPDEVSEPPIDTPFIVKEDGV